jgi:predicted nuclease of restriction endonuclease-like (RecB) superfamily
MKSKERIINNPEYKEWILSLKQKVRSAQLKAAVKVNVELLQLYWDLGADIAGRQTQSSWGDGFLTHLSRDLISEFPDMKGFSKRNLELIRQWFLFWQGDITIAKQPVSQLETKISQQLIGQIKQIPWGHNLVIISKCKNIDDAAWYVRKTIEHGWSRTVLVHQIESGLINREGKSISNFPAALPEPLSELAQQTVKDPYIFDFLSLTSDYTERDLENSLVEHVSKFLLELGAGFAYIGRQVPLQVGDSDFFIDLLFYHIKLHCYIVIELKTTRFEPEHAGKLNFYIKAVDTQLRTEQDAPTIGIIICKKRDKLVAEYALSDINKPIGVSEYRLTESLPDQLKSSLPSIEEIEAELKGLK